MNALHPLLPNRSWVAAAAVCVASMADAAEQTPPRVMLGYYATFGDLPVELIPWSRLTHVAHAFLRLDAEGGLVKTGGMPNPALTSAAHAAGVEALVSVGGGLTVKGFEAATKTEADAKSLAQRIVGVVIDGGYDGVDLDWEFPRDAATRDAHTRLVGALRAELDAARAEAGRDRPYLLTAAVSASPFFGEWIDAPRVAPLVDWLHVMAYDMAGAWSREAAHHAPLFPSPKDPEGEWRSVSAAMAYWRDQRRVPAAKLLVGIPLFGQELPAEAPFAALDPSDAARFHSLPFHEIRGRVGQGWLADWDNRSQAPWLYPPGPRADKTAEPLSAIAPSDAQGIVAYDDRNSVHAKSVWARQQGFGGLFFWAIHQDRMPDGTHWLLDAAAAAWPAQDASIGDGPAADRGSEPRAAGGSR